MLRAAFRRIFQNYEKALSHPFFFFFSFFFYWNKFYRNQLLHIRYKHMYVLIEITSTLIIHYKYINYSQSRIWHNSLTLLCIISSFSLFFSFVFRSDIHLFIFPLQTQCTSHDILFHVSAVLCVCHGGGMRTDISVIRIWFRNFCRKKEKVMKIFEFLIVIYSQNTLPYIHY